MSLAPRVWSLRALAHAELSPKDVSKRFPAEFKKVNFDGMTEDEACLTMESLRLLRKVDKDTSGVFVDYLWGKSPRLPTLSLQNKLRACVGLKDLREHHSKHKHVVKKLFSILNEKEELTQRKLFVDALLRCGELTSLTLGEKHRVIKLVLSALEDGVAEPLWALPRALQALKIHDEKVFVAFAGRVRVDNFSYKEMVEFVRRLARWEVGPPGMKRCALTVFTDLHPPTAQTTFIWARVLSRLTTAHVQQPFIDALMDLVPSVARRLNAEKLLLLANALSYNFAYAPQFALVVEEVENQLPLEVYNFEDYAALFRASLHLRAPALAAELKHRILDVLPNEPHKAAAKVLLTAAKWSKQDASYIPLVDAMIQLTNPAERIKVLGAASDPAPLVQSVTDELSLLSRQNLRACSVIVRDAEAAAKIIEDFERRELDASDVQYWLRTCHLVPELMNPLVVKHASDNTSLGAACRDALYWENSRERKTEV